MTETPSPFMSIDPSDLTSWLSSNGWRRVPTRLDIAQLWERDADEVLQPLSISASDYSLRVDQLLRRLASQEKKSEAAIELELLEQGSDVTEWSVETPYGEHTLAIVDVELVIATARKSLVASAGTAIKRSGYFGRAMPKRAYDYVKDGVRVGPTRAGSYVIPVISRLSQPLPPAAESSMFPEEIREKSLPRKATERLALSLDALNDFVTADQEITGKRINELVLDAGVSAELCDALTSTLKAESLRNVAVTFSWARREDTSVQVRRVDFPSESRSAIERVSRRLRQAEPPLVRTFPAFPETVTRGIDDAEGNVRLRVNLDGTERHVAAYLNDELYQVAIEANEARRNIDIRGRLIREPGALWRLEAVETVRPADMLLADE